jgi:hypothetical protein
VGNNEVSEEVQAYRDAHNIYLVAARMADEGKITDEQHEEVDHTPRTEEARALLNYFLVQGGHEPYEFEDTLPTH